MARNKRRVLSALIAIGIVAALKLGGPMLVNVYDDYMATADPTIPDAELRKQLTGLLQMDQFLEAYLGEQFKCIPNAQVRMQTAARLVFLIKSFLGYDDWIKHYYSREEMQRSIRFLSSSAGQEFVKAWSQFMQKIASQVETDQAGNVIPSSMEVAIKNASPILSDLMKNYNGIEKAQFRHFEKEGLLNKIQALDDAMAEAAGRIINMAETNNPALDQQIRPLLEPYYNHYNSAMDNSCRTAIQAP